MKIATTAVELIIAPSPATATISRTSRRVSLLPALAFSQSPSRRATPVRTKPSPITNSAAIRTMLRSLKPASASGMRDDAGERQRTIMISATASMRGRLITNIAIGGREQQENDGQIDAHPARSRPARGGAHPSPQGSPSRCQAARKSVHSTHSTSDVRQHQRHHRPHARVLLVLLGEGDDQREVRVQRRDGVHRRIADPVGGQHRLRRDVEPHQQRHEDGREDRPFRDRAGDDQIEEEHDDDEPDQQPQRVEVRVLEDVGQRHGGERRHVGVVEVGQELADDQQQEDQAAQAGDRLAHRVDDVVACSVIVPAPMP